MAASKVTWPGLRVRAADRPWRRPRDEDDRTRSGPGLTGPDPIRTGPGRPGGSTAETPPAAARAASEGPVDEGRRWKGSDVATYVLVHGGGHGGWCYRKVARLLRAAGH